MVSGEALEKKNATEVSKALAGEVSGVQVVTTSGQPGTNASIRIRGIGSVNSSTSPLYVVDGVPYDGDVSNIDPSDIASTTVLKDATATSLYGSRGANGVILITTKKGSSDTEGKIDVDFKYGANMRLIPMYETIQDPTRYVELGWLGLYNNSGNATTASNMLFGPKGIPAIYNMWVEPGSQLINKETGKMYDDVTLRPGIAAQPYESWEDNIFRTGQRMEANVKIHGGSDKTTYYTSFGYLKDEGYYIGSDYNRFTLRSNVDHQVKKWLKGNMNMQYSHSNFNNPGQGSNMNNGFAYVNGIPSIYPVFQRDADGYKVADALTGGDAYDYGMYEGGGRLFGSGINPAGALQLDKARQVQNAFLGNAMLEITFIKGLKLTGNFGLQYTNILGSQLTNKYYGDAAGVGRIYKSSSNYLTFIANQILSYTPDLGIDNSLSMFVAHETTSTTQSSMYGSKNYIARPEGLEWSNAIQMSYMESSTVAYAIESYFGQAVYNYKERYFVQGSLRGDGSSRFAKGNRWGLFGAIGASWVLSNEDFMQDVELLRFMKLKASWGVLGNQEIGLFLYEDMYSIENVDGSIGYTWTYAGNKDLTWEKSNMFNVGVEFDLGRYLSAEVEYFYKKTDNMLFPRSVSPSLGYSYYYVNEGALSNQGVEATFKVHAVDTRQVKLDFRLTGSWYRNEILSMPLEANGEPMIMNGSWSKGHSLNDYYMPRYAGVNEQTGLAQYVAFYDANRVEDPNNLKATDYITSVYIHEQTYKDADIREIIVDNAAYAGYSYIGKSAAPDLQGGFGIDLELYGFDISASFVYQIGGWGYDNVYSELMHSDRVGSYNWHKDIEKSWSAENTKTDVPRLSNGTDFYANAYSDRFLTSTSYLSLQNVRVGYSFPKKWIQKIKLNNLNLWVSGDNLFLISARKGYIPYVSFSGSSNSYQYTPLSTVMAGIRLQF